jgi:hypothetical protein
VLLSPAGPDILPLGSVKRSKCQARGGRFEIQVGPEADRFVDLGEQGGWNVVDNFGGC